MQDQAYWLPAFSNNYYFLNSSKLMDILYQDDSLIVVNKPAGLLTIRDGYNPDLPTVKTILEEDFGRCWIVHRLDKETSGVLIIAKNETAHRLINLAFQNHEINKIYHAIVLGVPSENEYILNLPLRIDGDRKHRTVVDFENGKPAISSVSIITVFEYYSLVSIKPETGYTHQIRAHLAYSGYPILGDKLYQKPNSNQTDLISRTALHAYQITFIHPLSNSPVTIQAEYPEDFRLALSNLAK
ncbi:MAG: RluA family pseudouridine synthase [Anaerolinea sp.]|nr:RluA family pseudouridine synthase [Anaerolinea sp.]